MSRSAYEADIGRRLHEAVSVPFRTVTIGDWRPLVARCHDNVDAWVASHPRSASVRGWVTYASCGEAVGLTAHSVVQDADGQLVDITPLGDEKARAGMRFVRHIGSDDEFHRERKRNTEIWWPSIDFA